MTNGQRSSWLWYGGIGLIMFGGACLGNFSTPPAGLWPMLGALASGLGLLLQGLSRRRMRIENWWPRTAPADRRPVLILTLSECRDATEAHPVPEHIQLTGDLDQDLAALAEQKRRAQGKGPLWNWEMPLRAIQYQLSNHGPLERIVLLCSPESIGQAHWFVECVLWRYSPLTRVRVEVHMGRSGRLMRCAAGMAALPAEDGVDLTDFDQISDTYAQILDELRGGSASSRHSDRFHRGPKPASVVAATITVGSWISNQYVATNPRDRNESPWVYEVLGYNFTESAGD